MKPGRVTSSFGVKDPVSQTETTFDVTIIDIQCTDDYPQSNMKTQSASKDTVIPADLLEQVQAMATAEHRSPIEIFARRDRVVPARSRQPCRTGERRVYRRIAFAAGGRRSHPGATTVPSHARGYDHPRHDDARAGLTIFVLDNSIAMRWAFAGGAHPDADAIRRAPSSQLSIG